MHTAILGCTAASQSAHASKRRAHKLSAEGSVSSGRRAASPRFPVHGVPVPEAPHGTARCARYGTRATPGSVAKSTGKDGRFRLSCLRLFIAGLFVAGLFGELRELEIRCFFFFQRLL